MPVRLRKSKMGVPFTRKLILNHWALGLLGVERFEDLAKHLCAEHREGLDDDNVHRFHHELCQLVPPERRPELTDDALLRHDQAIVSATHRINDARRTRGLRAIRWKYFQYLALLFAEIYLERWFNAPDELLASLTHVIEVYNHSTAKQPADRVEHLDAGADPRAELNKIAFWMATGSGKTLLMHAHILRYRELLRDHGRAGELNRILLLTPNEGLSRQHLGELNDSGIPARMFSKEGGELFEGETVEILDIHKLAGDMGDKTVAVSALEGQNLVLVDEGHCGASSGSGGVWIRYRDQLCEDGFSFEYSATFGQAVKGDRDLTTRYARSTLFDYSYRWFHGDGFGKDYRILNLEDDSDEWRATYLTGALLSFFQQQWLFEQGGSALRPYNIERPLWVFVGSKVTKSLATKDASDVVEILRFLAAYVSEGSRSVARIAHLLDEDAGPAGPQRFLHGTFRPLTDAGLQPREIFRRSLATTFNAPSGGLLRVERLKGTSGELALRIGENEPFGVVNVGDAPKLAKLCDAAGLETAHREFADPLFHRVNDADSGVHLVVGAKKFTEGWNSWRVSSMGLMNVGRSEGSQIIQLFGRGVRLKGCRMSLKRSSRLDPPPRNPPRNIEDLETLQVFGVRASYMRQFRDFLQEEGVATDPIEEFVPIRRPQLPAAPLKTIRLAENVAGDDPATAFRGIGPMPVLRAPGHGGHPKGVADRLARLRVTLNWYPRIRALESDRIEGWGTLGELNEEHLSATAVALLDIDALYIALQRFKRERGWQNLAVSRTTIAELLADGSWYRLRIPAAEMRFDDMAKAKRWQEIALALLKKYATRYYGICRQAWEVGHLEYCELTRDDDNFPTVTRDTGAEHGYRVVLDAGADPDLARRMRTEVRNLAESVKAERFPLRPGHHVKPIPLDEHLYLPLLTANERYMTLTPPALNDGEQQFVRDFRDHCSKNQPTGVRYHLLRNLSRGHGVGFFEANNFHPDFILWAVMGRRQHIAFVDPKGLVHMGPGNPKVRLRERIKEIESRLGDPDVRLDSFTLSVTESGTVKAQWGMTKAEMADRHVLFMKEDRDTYIGEMLRRMEVPGSGPGQAA